MPFLSFWAGFLTAVDLVEAGHTWLSAIAQPRALQLQEGRLLAAATRQDRKGGLRVHSARLRVLEVSSFDKVPDALACELATPRPMMAEVVERRAFGQPAKQLQE